MRKLFITAILTFLFILSLSGSAWTASGTVSWTANTDDTVGYKVYWGTTSGIYDNNVDVGNVTTYQILNLLSGTTYYAVITAYDPSANESGYSNEASATHFVINVPKNVTITITVQ